MASDPTSPLVPARSIAKTPDAIFLIVGMTSAGKPFRPSDWNERLAGVMACFRPPGSVTASPLQCSPYAVPGRYREQTCVRVDPAIATAEPLALTFLLNFARDNDLQLALTSDFT